ncbi:terminase small subunit [Mycobacterium phage Gancho]|uniref:Terminase small subunit n=1 Tax=Mycobacterium phage Gancho TaxID=2301613 RepID=A0A385UHJ7_9CAUD|nr:terminase small subunit [Mycobacterium phage Gancho]
MTPPRAAVADTPETPAEGKSGAKTRAKKGAAPAKKAAKRAAPARKRASTGRKTPVADRVRSELGRDGDPVGIVLLVQQAARVAERIDRINDVLSGTASAWARVGIPRLDTDGGRIVVEVRVDDLVKEERQQTGLLRNLLAEIHRQRSGQPAAPPDVTREDDDLDVD